MDQVIHSTTPTSPLPQVSVRADVRPTADAAAIAKDPTPDVPLPIPATLSPIGAVNQSRMTQAENTPTGVNAVDRTLKPYGITMLPYATPDEAADKFADATQDQDSPSTQPE